IPVYFSVRVKGKVVYGGKVVLPNDPIQPPELSGDSDAPERVRLAWSGGPAAKEYRVDRLMGAAGWIQVAVVPGTSTSWVGSDHVADTEYEYRIRAVTSHGKDSA